MPSSGSRLPSSSASWRKARPSADLGRGPRERVPRGHPASAGRVPPRTATPVRSTHPTMIKRLLLAFAALVLLLAAAVGVNTLRQGSRQVDVAAAPPLPVDAQAVADKLAGAIRFRTITSVDDPAMNLAEFRNFHAFLQQRFPL